jgi:hypothetical protein
VSKDELQPPDASDSTAELKAFVLAVAAKLYPDSPATLDQRAFLTGALVGVALRAVKRLEALEKLDATRG